MKLKKKDLDNETTLQDCQCSSGIWRDFNNVLYLLAGPEVVNQLYKMY